MGHCACRFSSGGVLKYLCQWHTSLIEQRVKAERKACADLCERLGETAGFDQDTAYQCGANIIARVSASP